MAPKDLEPRLQGTEEGLNRLRERIATIEGRLTPQPSNTKQPYLIVLLSILVTAAVGYCAWLGVEVVVIGKDIASLKTSIGDLTLKQASTALNLAGQGAKSGNKGTARIYLTHATELVQKLAVTHVPSSQSFFKEAVNDLNEVTRAGVDDAEVHQALLRLAEYRSSLQPRPSIESSLRQIPVRPEVITPNMVQGRNVYRLTGPITLLPKIHFVSDGAVFNGSEIPEGTSLLNPVSRTIADNQNEISGLIIIARNQVLDGIVWKNVTFVNTHVIYAGDDLSLQNVKFVNCTFETPPTNKGLEVLQYAALNLPTLTG